MPDLNDDQNIIVGSVTLTDVFTYNLAIPEYQRPYVWGEELILKFCNQIFQHTERSDINENDLPHYYLGCIVLHDDGSHLNIIDGQQRITTLILISKLKGLIVKDLHFYHPLSFQNINKNFTLLEKEYNNPKSKLRSVIARIDFDQINVTIIKTKNEDQAYNFFETLNTGGVRLSGTDILKAHHLRSISNGKIKEFAKNWEKRQKNLEKVNKILVKARRMNPLLDNSFPGKYGSNDEWKKTLTDEFSEKTGKEKRDIGFADVLIEKNTHTILSDKYSIRQPLNDGENYINYFLSFTDIYDEMFKSSNNTDFYTRFNEEVINVIDGTVDLKSYYELIMMCFVDKYGKEHFEEFAFWAFRFIYSLRVGEKTRIYEATVRNFFIKNNLLERVLYSYKVTEVLGYLKSQPFEILSEVSGVRERFLFRVNKVLNLSCNSETFSDLDEKFIDKIESNYAK